MTTKQYAALVDRLGGASKVAPVVGVDAATIRKRCAGTHSVTKEAELAAIHASYTLQGCKEIPVPKNRVACALCGKALVEGEKWKELNLHCAEGVVVMTCDAHTETGDAWAQGLANTAKVVRSGKG
jgi:hypothetical protein